MEILCSEKDKFACLNNMRRQNFFSELNKITNVRHVTEIRSQKRVNSLKHPKTDKLTRENIAKIRKILLFQKVVGPGISTSHCVYI